MRVSFETISGAETRYFHCGSGRHGVFFLHGVGVGSDSWFWNLEALSGAGRMCVAPDLLGFGMTGDGTLKGDEAPQGAIVEHLAALADHLGFDRVSIVGSSFGSQIACHLYWRLAGRVDRMVLVGCGPALNGPDTLEPMYQQSFANGSLAMRDPTLEVCRRRMRNLVHEKSEVPEALLLVQLTLYGLPRTRKRYEQRMGGIMTRAALERYDVIPRLRSIDVPTLVIWGRQDIRGDMEEALNNCQSLPMGRVEIFEDCGHLPYLEHPEPFNGLVRSFLEESAAGDGRT